MAHFVQVWVASKLHHGRGSAHQNQGVFTGGGQVVTDHVLVDEAFTVFPVWNTTDEYSYAAAFITTASYSSSYTSILMIKTFLSKVQLDK